MFIQVYSETSKKQRDRFYNKLEAFSIVLIQCLAVIDLHVCTLSESAAFNPLQQKSSANHFSRCTLSIPQLSHCPSIICSPSPDNASFLFLAHDDASFTSTNFIRASLACETDALSIIDRDAHALAYKSCRAIGVGRCLFLRLEKNILKSDYGVT